MKGVISDTAAAVAVVVDANGGASLTEMATATGKSLSTVQRATSALARANVLVRAGSRGRFTFSKKAPRDAVRDIAEWQLGSARVSEIRGASEYIRMGGRSLPASITKPEIRRSLPGALSRIVHTFEPDRVVLFGSQARGDADSQSDVDLLVVFPRESDRRERQVAIRRLLADMPFAKDVLVTWGERYEHPLPGTAVKSAVAEGVTLYER